jgi:methionyl-tRNA synthetase
MELINSAKADLIEFNFIACIHKVHLVLINLNNHVHATEFWKKSDQKEDIIQLACFTYEFIRIVAILYKPILPTLMSNINKYIGIDQSKINFANTDFRLLDTENVEKSGIACNTQHNQTANDGYFNINTNYKNLIFVNKKKN